MHEKPKLLLKIILFWMPSVLLCITSSFVIWPNNYQGIQNKVLFSGNCLFYNTSEDLFSPNKWLHDQSFNGTLMSAFCFYILFSWISIYYQVFLNKFSNITTSFLIFLSSLVFSILNDTLLRNIFLFLFNYFFRSVSAVRLNL